MRLISIESSFHPCNIYRDCPRDVPREAKMCKKCAKMANFWTYGLDYWETVEDRWVLAAMRLTSIEFSFDTCKFTAIVPGAYPGEAKICLGSLDVAKCFQPQDGWGNDIPAWLSWGSQILLGWLQKLTHVLLAIAILLVCLSTRNWMAKSDVDLSSCLPIHSYIVVWPLLDLAA